MDVVREAWDYVSRRESWQKAASSSRAVFLNFLMNKYPRHYSLIAVAIISVHER